MSLLLSCRDPTAADFIRACQKDTSDDDPKDPIAKKPLPADAAERLLKRAPPIDADESDKKEWNQREKTLPPPRTGDTVRVPFPPDVKLEKPAQLLKEEAEIRKELRVMRTMPEGKDLDVVPQVVVTFNQPMVPVTGVDELKKFPVPVKMTPVVEGEWRWVGTKTVKWKPTHRLPKSTEFVVQIPSGVKSEWGVQLKDPVEFKFSTIPLKISDSYPRSDLCSSDPVLFFQFNQKIDVGYIAERLRVDGPGGPYGIKVLTHDEVRARIDKDNFMKKKLPSMYYSYERYLASGLRDQHIWFCISKQIPLSSSFKIVVTKGSRSAEGPRVTTGDLTRNFKTYGPMSYVRHSPTRQTVPLATWSVTLSNPIDLEEFDPVTVVRVVPPIEDMVVTPSGSTLSIRGRSKGRTIYILTLVSKEIKDVYGQNLVEDKSVSIDVGPAKQNLYGFHNRRVIVHDMTMGPMPKFSVVTVNVPKARVCIYQVEPIDYHKSFMGRDYRYYSHSGDEDADEHVGVGKKVYDQLVEITGEADELAETIVDLAAFVKYPDEGIGHLIVYVEPEQATWKGKWQHRPRIRTWVQVTKLAVDAFWTNGNQMYMYGSHLVDGSPLASGTDFTLSPCAQSKVSRPSDYTGLLQSVPADKDGLAYLAGYSTSRSPLVWVKQGNDVAFVNGLSYMSFEPSRNLSYCINDRNLYKPKETVSIKGIIRRLTHKDGAKVLSVPKCVELTYKVTDARRSEIGKGEVTTNEHGSFFVSFDLPDNLNLGDCHVNFRGGQRGSSAWSVDHSFQVQEFRTPEFSATAKVPNGPYFVGGIAIATGNASYYSGGGMSGCTADWKIAQSATSYTPPGWTFKRFSFGCDYRPLVVISDDDDDDEVEIDDLPAGQLPKASQLRAGIAGMDPSEKKMLEMMLASGAGPPGMPPGMLDLLRETLGGTDLDAVKSPFELEGSTNAQGEHKMCVEFLDGRQQIKTPVSVSCNFNAQDINRQTMGASTSFIVHPSANYVGLKLGAYYAKAGKALPMDVVVTDLEGVLVADREVTLKIIRRDWFRKGYDYKEEETLVDTIKWTCAAEEKSLTLTMAEGGSYYLVASVLDEAGRVNFASRSLWVSGGRPKTRPKGGSSIQMEEVNMIANKTEYDVDDQARILVTAPFDAPADGVVLVVCNGYTHKERFHMDEQSHVITLPILRRYVPNAVVKVFLAGQGDRMDAGTGRPSKFAPKRPAYAEGTLNLSVPPKKMTIECTVAPAKEIMSPGEEGTVTVALKCAADEGFSGEGSAVSLIIVDEAVLALTGYSLPDPVSRFWVSSGTGARSIHLRQSVIMKDWSSIRVEAAPKPKKDCKRGRGVRTCCRGCYGGCAPPGCCGCSRCCCDECKRCCNCAPQCVCATSAPMMEECEGCCCMEDCDCDGCMMSECGAGAPPPEEEPGPAIEVRTNFNPLACFLADELAGADGKVTFKFQLPDNLTRYRVWCIAHKGSDFYGLGESKILAQLPVAVRPSLPRFLNFGDKSDFAVVVQNQSPGEITVHVAVRMTNLKLQKEEDRAVVAVIPYSRRAELRFPVTTESCGTARFQVVCAVAGSDFADAAEKDLPIFTPSTTEAFATYGELDDAVVVQPILPPADIYNQFGGLQITTSSTALQALTDAFLYLLNYEYDCVEQATSRILSIVSLQDILFAFNVPKMPSMGKLRQIVGTGLEKVKTKQRPDGAFGFWTVKSDVNIYLSVYVAHMLIRASAQGYDVDGTVMNRSKTFCQNVERYLDQYVKWYSPSTKASIRSFALYVLTVFSLNKKLTPHEKDLATKQAESLWREHQPRLSMEGKAWLVFCLYHCSPAKGGHAIVKEVIHDFMNNVNETPETANFITSYGDDGKLVMLHSSRRTDGVILEVLIDLDRENKLIPKIVKGLLAHRKKGRWGSTQENCYILLALKKYFQTYEKIVPDFVCRMWLGEDYAGEVEFRGRETDYKVVDIPMKVILPDMSKPGVKKDLVLWKKGAGRLYYRLGMDYAPRSLDLKPVDYGFIVERTYEAVTDPKHVVKDPDSGVWTFKAGELIRVKLRLTNVSRRYHVALVDFIPAGCEVENPDLQGGRVLPASVKADRGSHTGGSPYLWRPWYCWSSWYEHVNRRDERVEAFASYLYCGAHEYEYIMSATSLGEYVVPPAKAEEMYAPELFGRSASEKVIIKE